MGLVIAPAFGFSIFGDGYNIARVDELPPQRFEVLESPGGRRARSPQAEVFHPRQTLHQGVKGEGHEEIVLASSARSCQDMVDPSRLHLGLERQRDGAVAEDGRQPPGTLHLAAVHGPVVAKVDVADDGAYGALKVWVLHHLPQGEEDGGPVPDEKKAVEHRVGDGGDVFRRQAQVSQSNPPDYHLMEVSHHELWVLHPEPMGRRGNEIPKDLEENLIGQKLQAGYDPGVLELAVYVVDVEHDYIIHGAEGQELVVSLRVKAADVGRAEPLPAIRGLHNALDMYGVTAPAACCRPPKGQREADMPRDCRCRGQAGSLVLLVGSRGLGAVI